MFNLTFNRNISPKFKNKIQQFFLEAEKIFSKYYDFSGYEIDFYLAMMDEKEEKSEILLETKVAGMAMTGFQAIIFLFVDEEIKKEQLWNMIFHELNHEYRSRLFRPQSDIFGDTILEGLALTFEKQMMSENNYQIYKTMRYSKVATEQQIKDGLRKILQIAKNNESFNYNDWYYNLFNENPEMPSNFVYQIGEYLIEKYCDIHKIKPSDALQVSNREFEKFARKEILCEV